MSTVRHPHTASARAPRRRPAAAALLLATLATLTAACGSDDPAGEPDPVSAATAAASTAPGATAAPAETAGSAVPAMTEAPAMTAAVTVPDVPGLPPTVELCPTLPDLAVIEAALGEPGTMVEESDPIFGSCEVTGTTSSVQFERTDAATGQDLIDTYASQGVLVEFSDPALPGAVAGANVVQVIIGDTYYAVQLITLDSVIDPDSPAALAASAGLLRAWLDALGV